MATYGLVKRDGDAPAYRYWPEGDKSSKRGTIIVDLSTETASLAEPAERDFKSRTTGTDMNAMRDENNRMRLERGEEPLAEDELPTKPDDEVYEWWVYYDHALRDMSRRHDAGEIPDRGMVAWS